MSGRSPFDEPEPSNNRNTREAMDPDNPFYEGPVRPSCPPPQRKLPTVKKQQSGGFGALENEKRPTSPETNSRPNTQSSPSAEGGRGGGGGGGGEEEGEEEGSGEEVSKWDKMTRFMKESAAKGVKNIKDSVADMHIGEKTKKAFESVKFNSDQQAQQEQAQLNDIDELLAPPKPDDVKAIFGVPYEVAVERSATVFPGIPDVIVFCLAFLDRLGFEEEGIFRLSGSKREIAMLRGIFQAGGSPPKGNMTTQHSVTGLLKLYFRELPEGIFTKRKAVTAPQGGGGTQKHKYRCVYESLYEPYKPVVPFLFYFLRKVKINK